MPYHRLYYHIVWATSGRQPMIVPDVVKVVYSAIWDKAESLQAKVFAIGGIEDHVHLAVGLPPTIAIADFVAGIKGASAYHINHTPGGDHRIKWQRGYGVLSFSRDHLDRVVQYINGQKDHHSKEKLWASLEDYGGDGAQERMIVRETQAEYDPFACLGFAPPSDGVPQ